jgi:transglutaminase-like putative cysteine protease
MSTPEYTRETTILDYRHPSIEELVLSRGWRDLSDFDRIGGVYSFVRDEIAFGYNADDALNASAVLRDGYGQCNTKGTLLMALLRAVDIPCRFHGFTIENDLQRGAIPGYMLPLGPPEIIHSWVEVEYRGRWLNIEGFILDLPYLRAVQKRFADTVGGFSGYAVATKDLANPPIEWRGESTYIQSEGIARDLGTYHSPDDFYARHGSNLRGIKRFLYAVLFRHLVNANVRRIRSESQSDTAESAGRTIAG